MASLSWAAHTRWTPASQPEDEMDDQDVIARIDSLIEEEHSLHRRHPDGLEEGELERLEELEVQLDQCWDLLRQRRARRHAGQDPDAAAARDPNTVEGYQQ
jgi:hypothetical protein